MHVILVQKEHRSVNIDEIDTKISDHSLDEGKFSVFKSLINRTSQLEIHY